MVKAELLYNPYMLETVIKFNKQPPRINSLVEKYQTGMLQDWISVLPDIFHDEMNGYDFELEFSGTTRDFNELKRAFNLANVSEEQVRLFHKNVLEDRDKKIERIESLLNWLADNPNRNFDNNQFRKDNEILFDEAYSIVLIHGEHVEIPKIDWVDTTVEMITDVRDLDNTDLTFTPIVISVDQNTFYELQRTLKYLKRRGDVQAQQLFFIVDETMNQDTIYRTIKDLGIKSPQVIESLTDEKLKKYFEIYPETEYITSSINMFIEKTNAVEAALAQELEQGKKTNTEIDKKTRLIYEEIQRTRDADEELTTKSNIDKPAAFNVEKSNLDLRTTIWRKKKTKSVDSEEACKLAEEFQQEAQKYYDTFTEAIIISAKEAKTNIDVRLASAYEVARCEDGFCAEQIKFKPPIATPIPDFQEELLGLHTEEKVRKNNVGFFYIASKNPEEEYDLQTAYYMQKWREHVASIIDPLSEVFMDAIMEALSDYDRRATDAYHEHLMQIVADRMKEEEELSKQLSSEEKRLQQDGAWLSEFRQQLKSIARG